MSLQGPKTAAWFDRAKQSLVNGVSSGWRYWGEGDTLVIDRGEGSYLFDLDGKRYIDYIMGFGPIILGHGDRRVVDAVAAAVADGTVFAMTMRNEVEAAELFKEAVPWVEGLRFGNTGTEATMHALRLARGFTGRDVVVKFEGQYHGAHDYVMYSTPSQPLTSMGSRFSPIAAPMSSGMPQVVATTVRVLPYNDLEAARRLFADEGRSIAAVMVEPMMGNVMGIQPQPGFLEGLRQLCDNSGSVLIFDEVKTGFRVAVGGAAEAYGVVPDLGTFAKAMGNGIPVAAIAGRGEVLDGWRTGGIVQAGTYSGNGASVAAVAATITALMTGEPLAQVTRVGEALMEGLAKTMADKGLTGTVLGHPSMFSIFLGEGTPMELRHTAEHNEELYEEITMAMIRRGVMPCPDALEPWFISAAHTDDDVTETLEVFAAAIDEVRS